MKFSVLFRNAELNGGVAYVGASPILKIRTGNAPTNMADADSGTVLATMTLPSTWMAAASSGAAALAGTWHDASADATGDAGHFRIYLANGTTQFCQGSVGKTGDEATKELILAQATVGIVAGQEVAVASFGLTAGTA